MQIDKLSVGAEILVRQIARSPAIFRGPFQGGHYRSLDLRRGDTGDRASVLPAAVEEGCGDVVAIPGSTFLRGAGRHSIAAIIENMARQERTVIDAAMTS